MARAKYEEIDKDNMVKDPNSLWFNDLQGFAMRKLAYFQCFKCKSAYFGGLKDDSSEMQPDP
jgi:E3 ubiquitin-protein ligase MYCBP2